MTGTAAPLPTVTNCEEDGRRDWKLPGSDAMWEDAPVSMCQSPPGSYRLLRAARRAGSNCGFLLAVGT
jgi:hypothetical protein